MAIDQLKIEKLEKDIMSTKLAGRLNGLYYYYLEPALYSTLTYDDGRPVEPGKKIPDNTSILGTTDAICNVSYVPFMSVSEKDLKRIPYDSERFGKIEEEDGPETSHTMNFPFVFRLKPANPLGDVILSTIKLYPTATRPTVGTKRHHKYESRLLDYPYRTIMFQSNVFTAFEVVPNYVAEIDRMNNKVEFLGQTQINPGGNFVMFVKGYKGDAANFMERQFSGDSMDMPNTSSAYSNYMSTQKAQATNSVWSKPFAHGLASSVASVAGATMTGGIPAGTLTAATALAAGLAGSIAAHSDQIALKKDLVTTPNSLKSTGSDLTCRLGRLDKAYVYAAHKTIHDDYKAIIADFFAMYGYKQSKVMKPNLRSRYYYNYIKTVGANIKGKGIPKQHLMTLKAIFDNGTTLWHVDRNGDKFMDYTYDNTEMKFV